MRRLTHIPSLLLVGALLGACAGAIVELPAEGPLNPEQIQAALQGDDFRIKAHARDELKKLPEADRMPILQSVLTKGDAQTRLLVVAELAVISPPLSDPLLRELASGDPDPEVKEFASMVLEERSAIPEQ